LEYQSRLVRQYSVCFGEGGEADELSAKWGWYPVLYALAGEQFLEMDAVTEKPITAVLGHLAFLKDLEHVRNDKFQQHSS
jgi:hypothetical protein